MKKGFTLAEVLITLTIIGIVAAVTIPSVIANYQQQEFKTGLRKAVSVLNEAIQVNMSQEGMSPYDRGNTWPMESAEYLDGYLKRHMNVVTVKNEAGDGGKYLSDENHTFQGVAKNNAFYTADGMRFEFINNSGERWHLKLHESDVRPKYSNYAKCGSYGLKNNPHNTQNPPCLVLVDVNGDRKPTAYNANVEISDDNKSVKNNYIYPSPTDRRVTDIFNILITEDRAIPFGVVAQRAMYGK